MDPEAAEVGVKMIRPEVFVEITPTRPELEVNYIKGY